jgi:hypothetical protein
VPKLFFIVALLVEGFGKIWRAQPLFFNLRQHIRAVNSAEPDSGIGLVHRLRFASWVSVKMMDKNTDVHTIEGDRLFVV